MKDKGDGIPRCINKTSEGKNAEGKGRWSPKLASTKKYKRSAKVSRTGKLLQMIY